VKFIYADSLDYIDPHYDFISDRHGEGRSKYWSDQFAHEFMSRPPYDGILVSRGVVGDHLFKGKYTDSEAMRFRREGARAFLRYHESMFPGSLVFGDCGAFQYAKMEEPPYTPEDMIEFYSDGGFTHGCSVDHIIFHFDPKLDQDGCSNSRIPEDAKRRYEITLDLAERFIKLSRQIGGNFTPLGVVQGWSPLSMTKAAESLVAMGYKYLAIGGLVPLPSNDIHKILTVLRLAVPRNIKLHLLGFAKADRLAEFFRYDISSFDTSSPMIKAFKDESKNYYLPDANGIIQYYKAIRIPQALENNTLKKKLRSGRYSEEDLLAREERAFASIRGYSEGRVSIEETLETLESYSQVLAWDDRKSDEENIRAMRSLCEEYGRTLSTRPWDKCSCRVCRECGVEVIIFRASNRNKRRGIHNLEVFYDQLDRMRKEDG
jgi:hypothetical protein